MHSSGNQIDELTSVTVIFPAYNEASAVGGQVATARAVLEKAGLLFEVIVVDDGSKDRTAEEASAAGARVLQHPGNKGYGAAIKTGILAAANDTIAICDADGTYPLPQIPELISQLGIADMVVGARLGEQVDIPVERRPAKWLLTWLAQRIAGRPIPDLNSGMRLFRRECVEQYFPILSDKFSFTTTVTLAFLADNYHIAYVPINYFKRVGKSKISPRHFMDFVVLVLRMAMLFQPLRIFVPMSVFCTTLGLSKVVFDIISVFPRTSQFNWSLLFEPVLSTSAVLLLLVGLQLLLIGMVADGLLRRIAQHNGRLIPSVAMTINEKEARDDGIKTAEGIKE
jgi:glycosyltransferase involved in cell wall biosynthesis